MTQQLDGFDGTVALSGNWTVVAGAASCVGGILTGTAWPVGLRYTGSTMGPDDIGGITLTGSPASYVAIALRFTSAFNGYVAQFMSSGNIVVSREDAGVLTTLETITGFTFTNGDRGWLRCVGSRIQAMYNFKLQGNGATDATYGAADAAAVFLGASGDTIDLYEAWDWSLGPGIQPTRGLPNSGPRDALGFLKARAWDYTIVVPPPATMIQRRTLHAMGTHIGGRTERGH